jgi:lipoate-protein ligase B
VRLTYNCIAMRTLDLGLIPYRDAWRIQEELHEQVQQGGEAHLLLLEHPPVITLGRRVADAQKNLLAAPDLLAQLGVDVVESDRGGDITYHGPGQLVAYPIVRLADHGLTVGGYVHRLEQVVIDTLAEFGIQGFTDRAAVGVWVSTNPNESPRAQSAKICAIGVRIRRNTTLHGLAINLTTDLAHFNLINPCGLSRPVTSIVQILGERAPTMSNLKVSLTRRFNALFA